MRAIEISYGSRVKPGCGRSVGAMPKRWDPNPGPGSDSRMVSRLLNPGAGLGGVDTNDTRNDERMFGNLLLDLWSQACCGLVHI